MRQLISGLAQLLYGEPKLSACVCKQYAVSTAHIEYLGGEAIPGIVRTYRHPQNCLEILARN